MMKNRSLVHLFERSVNSFPERTLLWEKKERQYKAMTYNEAYQQVCDTARGLLTLGVGKGDRVALIAEGRNDWVISELAVLFCGGVCVPLSVKIEETADLHFRLNHAACKGIIVSGNHFRKIPVLIKQLPGLSFVVVLDPIEEQLPDDGRGPGCQILEMESVREQGKLQWDAVDPVLQERKRGLLPDNFANICYTSGTTADPKGIVLTHKNYLHNVEQASAIFEVPPEYTSLHILPWDHSFAHTVGIYALIRNGASIASLKTGRTVNETVKNIPVCIQEIRPHFLLSVPALAKNFRKNIERSVREKGRLAWWLFNAGMKVAVAYNREGYNKGGGFRELLMPLYRFFDIILFKKVRKGFGGRLKFFVGGGALLDIELQRFFYALGIPMFQGYGLTEASPVISSNTPEFHKLGSSGKVVPWMDLKICGEDGREKPIGEQGEIVIRGDNVMAGYWKNEEATAETIREGWLHTGDLGYLDHEGYLFVLGRSKSLLIGSDGEKYSPEGIEEAMMENSVFFDQVMLYNNQQGYTSALIVINRGAVLQYLSGQGLDPGTEEGQIAALERLKAELDSYIPGGELEGRFPPRWLPAAVAFLSDPFSETNGLVNSTMKIVRPAIHSYYQDTIHFLYTPDGKDLFNARNKAVISFLQP